MTDAIFLLGAPERAEALFHTLGDAARRPAPELCLRSNTAICQEDDLICFFSGTIYRCADASLPRESPAAWALAAWRKYGEDFLTRFEGKFILVLAEAREKRLFFARDHFGGIPLFWCAGDDFAAVSARLQPLADAGLYPKELSRAGLCDYFSMRYIPAPDTIFENLHALRPGHCVSARLEENGHVSVTDRCWWDVSCESAAMERDYDRCRAALREAVIQSVDERLFPGSNGVFLSGGIDSTIMLGAASALLGRKMDSFTIGFHEQAFDESPRAKIAAQAHGAEQHVYILNYDEALGELDRIISGFDQPFADDSAVPTWIINRFAAKEGIVNVLTGDGSDQIFAGSNKYFIRHYVDKLRKVPAPLRKLAHRALLALPDNSASTRKLRKVFACADMDAYEMRRRMLQLCLGDRELNTLLMGGTVDPSEDVIARLYRVKRDCTDELTNTLYVDLKLMVDGCMTAKMGSMSRLAGIETHMPLLSRDVLEAAFRTPPEFKQRGSSGKLILKDAFSDVIPDELKTASKKGFMPPVADWFRGPLLGDLKKELRDSDIRALRLFDPAFVQRMLDEHVNRSADRSVILWALYVFSKWYKRAF